MRWLSLPIVITVLAVGAPVTEASGEPGVPGGPEVSGGPGVSVEFEELHRWGFPSAAVWAVNEAGQAAGALHSPTSRPISVRWDGAGTWPTSVGRVLPTGINGRGDVLNFSVLKSAGALIYSISAWENGTEVERTPQRPTTATLSSRDINDSGVVPVGYHHLDDPVQDSYTRTRAGAWRNGKFADLPLPKAINVEHKLVNNRGTTAGSLTLLDKSADYAFRCSATRCTRLPGIAPTGYHKALALNESDVVAGTYQAAYGAPTRALVWTGNQVTVLPGDESGVADNTSAINESGDVVGWRVVDGVRKAALWRGGRAVDLGTSGASEAVAVNDRGDVVGWHTVNGGFRTFYWRAGTLTDLPTPDDVGALPTGLNNSGVVVGNTDRGLWPPARAFRWTVRLP
ncbi:hypothetical protein ABZ816_19015 [Actinosynnema sp. NPDC047251]|uniref:Uncharacterized protein n=1 Tax=Saccharothrix espanaensis (strain ATCC 51144 / DSM 44229 / JCM 9112 / NBRC 15066 / NRRL 15764) TaxID=1179773 RepID=K0K9F2_SACES|nr:hypothetical protein [Saccharothrix espanaensis]CCH33248.1 hypothetical protein BN6_59920 [Saccharothrix espanaensis DSM 44229]